MRLVRPNVTREANAVGKTISVLLLMLSLSGCHLLVPDKPLPTASDYSFAAQTCANNFHPMNPQFGQCVELQVAAKAEEALQRERLIGVVLGLEIPFWAGFAVGFINGVSNPTYYY